MRFYLLIMQSLLFLKLFLSQHSFKASHKAQTFKIVKREHIPRKKTLREFKYISLKRKVFLAEKIVLFKIYFYRRQKNDLLNRVNCHPKWPRRANFNLSAPQEKRQLSGKTGCNHFPLETHLHWLIHFSHVNDSSEDIGILGKHFSIWSEFRMRFKNTFSVNFNFRNIF